MNYDGSIVIKAEVDAQKAEKDIKDLNKKVDDSAQKATGTKTIKFNADVSNVDKEMQKVQSKIASLEEKKLFAEAQLSGVNAQKDALREQIRTAALNDQNELAAQLTTKWDALEKSSMRYSKSIEDATAKIDFQKEKFSQLAVSSVEVEQSSGKTRGAFSKMEKSTGRFALRLREVVRSALVFTVITQTLAKFRDWMGRVVKTSSEASASISKLKASLLTMAQPLVNVVIPAFTSLLNVLTDIVSTMAFAISALFGTTVEESAAAAESFNKEADALDGVGSAAKKAGKNLAAFDEINKLSNPSVGGGSSNKTGIEANFSDLKEGILSTLTISLKDILFDWENLTGEDILSKLIVALSTIAGGVIGFTLGGPAGAAVGVIVGAGVGLAISNLVFNGDGKLDEEELLSSVVLALGAIAGGVLGFFVGGPGGAAIGVMLGAGVSLGIRSLLFNGDGKVSQEELLGSIATALGALAGGVLGFIIGGPAGAALGVIVGAGITAKIVDVMFEQGNGAGVKNLIGGLVEFLVALGGGLIGFAIGGPVGGAIGAVVGVGLSLLIDKLFFKDGTSGKNKAYEEGEKIGEDVLKGTNDSLGINSPSTEYEKSGGYMMQGLSNGITGSKYVVLDAFRSVLSEMETAFLDWTRKFFVSVDSFSSTFAEKWENIWDAAYIRFIFNWNEILSIFQEGVNNAISALNQLVSAANALAGLTGSRYSYAPPITVDRLPIPALAQGAVIPPNREFMAVLGDQKSGVNIETPLSTMVEAFRTAMRDMNVGGQNEAYLVVDGETFGKVVYRNYNKESRRIGVSFSD